MAEVTLTQTPPRSEPHALPHKPYTGRATMRRNYTTQHPTRHHHQQSPQQPAVIHSHSITRTVLQLCC